MISHRNVIANIVQISTNEQKYRDSLKANAADPEYTQAVLGILPQSHIYGLVYISHYSIFRGDEVIVMSRFDIRDVLEAIRRCRIGCLFLVPPIIISMVKNKDLLSRYDLSSVRSVTTGAAPLGAETAEDLLSLFPSWSIRQGYGTSRTLPFLLKELAN